MSDLAAAPPLILPERAEHYYGGRWAATLDGSREQSYDPSTGKPLGEYANGTSADVDAAVMAAQAGAREWAAVKPLDRAKIMREVAAKILRHGDELAMIDAADCGNPYSEMRRDAIVSADQWQFFAGLVTEMKGDSIPMGSDVVNFTTRTPYGVVARIVAFNHPFMFVASKAAAPIAAGNAVIMKPPEQAPLSALRLAELVGGLLPDGVFNILTGGVEVGAGLTAHEDVDVVTLIGSVPTGRAVMKGASDTLKPVLLELGGKNALIGFPDADPEEVSAAAIAGMNFTWCGQSCGSTSRLFLHDDIYEDVVTRIAQKVKRHKPGPPMQPGTTMGALISQAQYDKTLSYIDVAHEDGATLLCGGKRSDDPDLADGYFIEPTIFTDVTQDMRIAREEVFGPILSILKWSDWSDMIEKVNSVEYGLTCSIWTQNLNHAHQTAAAVDAGFIWVNEVAKHFLGTPFGGFKQSGIGREECLEELLAFTQEKNIHIKMKSAVNLP